MTAAPARSANELARGDALRHLTLWVPGGVGLIGLFAVLHIAFKVGPF